MMDYGPPRVDPMDDQLNGTPDESQGFSLAGLDMNLFMAIYRYMIAKQQGEVAGEAKPKVRKQPKPKIDESRDEFERIRPTFGTRNSNIMLWRGMTRLDNEYRWVDGRFRYVPGARNLFHAAAGSVSGTAAADEPIAVTQPATIVRRHVDKVGNQHTRITVPPDDASSQAETKAERTAAFLANLRSCLDDDYQDGGGSGTRQAAIARYLAEDGHCYEWRLAVPERTSMPFTTRLLDPLSCYPVWGSEDGVLTIRRLYQLQVMSVRELREVWGEKLLSSKADGGTYEEEDEVEVVNRFDSTWTAIFLLDSGEGWIKKPTEHHYGCNPVQATFRGGFHSAALGEFRQVQANEREAARGRSVIADHIGTIDRMGQNYKAIQEILFKASRMPLWIENGPNDSGVDVQDQAGGVTQVNLGTKINALPSSPAVMSYFEALIAHDMDSLRADNLLTDPNVARTSGFDRLVASMEAQEVFGSLVKAVESHERRLCQDILTMYRSLASEVEGRQPVLKPIPITDDDGDKSVRVDFGPDDIPKYPKVRVELETLSPINQAQMLNQLVGPVGSGILSRQTALSQAGFDDPAVELARIREDLSLQSPAAIQTLAPLDIYTALATRAKQEAERGNPEAAAAADALLWKHSQEMANAMKPQPPAPPPNPMMGQPPMGPMGPGMAPPMDPMQLAMMQGDPTLGGLPMNTGTQPGMVPPEVATAGMNQMNQAQAMMLGL